MDMDFVDQIIRPTGSEQTYSPSISEAQLAGTPMSNLSERIHVADESICTMATQNCGQDQLRSLLSGGPITHDQIEQPRENCYGYRDSSWNRSTQLDGTPENLRSRIRGPSSPVNYLHPAELVDSVNNPIHPADFVDFMDTSIHPGDLADVIDSLICPAEQADLAQSAEQSVQFNNYLTTLLTSGGLMNHEASGFGRLVATQAPLPTELPYTSWTTTPNMQLTEGRINSASNSNTPFFINRNQALQACP